MMTGFSLPSAPTEVTAAFPFSDSQSAEHWLAALPLANTSTFAILADLSEGP